MLIAPESQQQQGVAASDVVIYGLNIIMPLMTGDLLNYPLLCTQYYKTIMYIVEMIPEKVRVETIIALCPVYSIL